MSKNEGEILRKLIKSSDHQVQEFAEKLGMTRQNLNYLFKKARIGEDIKERVAGIYGRSIEEIFDKQNDKPNFTPEDTEKETLRKLIAAQEEIIRNHKSFVTAQLIRIEAYEAETLEQVAELQGALGKMARKEVEALKAKFESDVKDRIQRIRTDLGL
jgi:transcriptional regulator with XRE-family HTH domain